MGPGAKVYGTVRDRLSEWGCDPFETLSLIAKGKLPCSVCHGAGRTAFQPSRGKAVGERKCQYCYGSGIERLSPGERGRAAAELAKYCEPQLRAIEVSGTATDDGNLVLWEEFIRIHRRRVLGGAAGELESRDGAIDGGVPWGPLVEARAAAGPRAHP